MIRTLSSGMRAVLRLSMLLAAGAPATRRSDGLVEVFHNGLVSLVSGEEYDLAEDLFRQVEAERFAAVGHLPPYSALQVVDFGEQLEETLLDRQQKAEFRAAFIKGDAGSGCVYWRLAEPGRMLQKKYGDRAFVEVTNEISYESLLAFDVVVIQRGLFGRDAAGIIAMLARLKAAGRKIVYEVDDDLWTLQPDNNCFFVADSQARHDIDAIVDLTDAVFTTNEFLKGQIGKPEKTFVLPNSIDLERFPFKERAQDREDVLFVLWHGGDSHEEDLGWMAKPMINLMKRHGELQEKLGKAIIFGFMGYFPKFIQPFMEFQFPVLVEPGGYDKELRRNVSTLTAKGRQGVKYIKGVEANQFHEYLYHLQPDICFAPLKPGKEFQNSKSSIKVVESTIAGAATVVADVGPYRDVPNDCVIKARTPEQMTQGILELMRKPERRQELHAKALAWVAEGYDLRNNVDLWYDALRRVKLGLGPEQDVSELSSAIAGER